MASRSISKLMPARRLPYAPYATIPSRPFRSAAPLKEAATATAPAPVRKPVGAFRGSIFGFLLGSFVAGAGTFYYVLEEYRVSNELLTEDIYALQSSVQRIHSHINNIEEKVDLMEKKKS